MPTWTKEQKTAIEKSGTNIIVSAGAGSGKTAVLSERVIYKLECGIHVDELLILTFTRAAAEEMKNRIRKKIAKKPEYREELDRLESAYITTFDSFALSVVKKYHYLLNIPPDIEITEDSIVSLKKTEIIDEVMDEMYKDPDENFTKLVTKFSLKSDRVLKETLLELSKKVESQIDYKSYLKKLKEDFYTEKNLNYIIGEFESLIEERKHNLALELDNAYHYFDGDYCASLDACLLPIINAVSFDDLISLRSTQLPKLKRGASDEEKTAKENLKVALNDLMSLTEFGPLEKIKSDIMETEPITLAVEKILSMFFEKLEQFKKEKNIYTFSDIAALAIKILEQHASAREELKDKFKEIMIDEYQDTNDVQEKFISMISDANVYMVGDIKQSIYRFRGSNPIIFKSKYDHFSKSEGGEKIDLIKNFRSRSEVLLNINRIFDLLMDDDLGGAAYTVSHEMVYGNSNYDREKVEDFDYDMEIMEYENEKGSEYTNSEVEIFAIARDIKSKKDNNFQVYDKETDTLRPFTYSDAVIILDRSLEFDLYKKIFEYLEIPLTILRDDRLTSKDDIYIIKNLIDFLIHIKERDFSGTFKYSFLSIGRSFLYEYTDEYLFDTIEFGNYKDTSLYKDISSIDDYNSKTVKELILDLLDKTAFLDKLYKIGDYQSTTIRIENILNLATNLGNLSYDIEGFKDYLENLIESGLEIKYTPSFIDTDSVKILTIHKSKGLEYPICYFADLDHAFNTRELKNKLIIDAKYGLISSIESEDGVENESVTKLLYKDTFYKEEIGEKIRLFYVALTRAREHIVIVLPKTDTRKLEKNRAGTIELSRRLKFKNLSHFIYAIKDYMPSFFKTIDLESLDMTNDYIYDKSAKDEISTPTDFAFEVDNIELDAKPIENKRFSKDTLQLITAENQKNMEFGTAVHEILEYTDFKNFDPQSIEDEFVRAKVSALLKDDLFNDVKNAKIYKEFEFVYENDEAEYHGSIDLMLEYTDHIDIVDYKLKNTVDEKYEKQLQGYKNYIEKISTKSVSTYLYSIIDETLTKID
ncbi:MAG TPA: hypothetical protein DCY94_02990 [Firmicutes bacterium]|nr:hypothetical protein [Bacillota bacterium]